MLKTKKAGFLGAQYNKPYRNAYIKGAGIGLLFLLWLYLGGLITQATSSGFITSKVPLSLNPLKCIAVNFTVGFQGLFCVTVLIGVAGAYLYIRHRDKDSRDLSEDERGFDTDNSGIYGTGRLLKDDEIKNYAEVEPLRLSAGIIIGKIPPETGKKDSFVSIPRDGCRFKRDSLGHPIVKTDENGVKQRVREKLKINGNRHSMIVGPSGSGKSYCYARGAILQSIRCGESVVITDPKGELFSDTSEYAKQHGYTVRILNLAHPPVSDSWDALAEVKGGQIGIEAQNFCNIIIENTSNPYSRGDEVYSNGEKNLLTALVLYTLTAPTYTGPKTIGAVYELLCKDEDELAALFDILPPNSIAAGPWSVFKTASTALRGNLKLGLGVRLQVMQDEVIKNVTGVPDIDLTLPGKSKCAYYVIMSDMHSTFQFISSLFFSCLFNRLVEYSRMQLSGKLPVSVNVIMDEFIAIGRLPDFDKKLATVRSSGINISMIFQTLAQLQASYPDGLWETLISNCTTMLCLSCNDLTTAKYLSDRSGTATVALDSTRVDRPLIELGYVPSNVTHSYSVGKREVLTMGEVVQLASDKVLVSIMSANLFIIDKVPYTDLVDPSSLIKVNMYDHVPAWMEQKRYIPQPDIEAERNIPYSPKKRREPTQSQAVASDPINTPSKVSPLTSEDDKDGDICPGEDIDLATQPGVTPQKYAPLGDSACLMNDF